MLSCSTLVGLPYTNVSFPGVSSHFPMRRGCSGAQHPQSLLLRFRCRVVSLDADHLSVLPLTKRSVLGCYFDFANGLILGNCPVPGNFLDLDNFLVCGNYYFQYFLVLDCPLRRRAIVPGTRYRRAVSFCNNCRLYLRYLGTAFPWVRASLTTS